MHKTANYLYDHSAKHSVKSRVERDIDSIQRKIATLEGEPRRNDPLLAAYRLMLQTRTEVLACLTDTLENEQTYMH
ncbi:hypothetical protein KO507_10140 [Gilvimarinus agarilyticus]|uniref:hypothetical protein n=1 Tax=unclassified Gilvimarinus TaxID=2642066 RepID=UPI001C092B6B|nr:MULTISPECIES: hypothetical protein [unclassified Gilvimarinus]MBU2886120.1 hypothetical protein [Gilvimarinus agarilyticus]MDO6570830.1 hypothetical protein [Gilvimarinus sp. 2_MG-2023]MDO6746998.1 hypothetical protein [Gilvimarinus sp. 1_MG-2023]